VNIADLLEKSGGIQLDIACGANKQSNFVGIDIQPLPGVDIVHDLANTPWPLPDDCVFLAMASHYVEHIPKVAYWRDETGGWHSYLPLIAFMDEVWRVMKPGGRFMIAVPHGHSSGFLQDPTHAAPLSEATWAYFDPSHPFYGFYKPKPWKIEFVNWDPGANMETVLVKLGVDNGA
jgi:SAM-dependent methyltransferase